LWRPQKGALLALLIVSATRPVPYHTGINFARRFIVEYYKMGGRNDEQGPIINGYPFPEINIAESWVDIEKN
jgi:hypothetical protein